MAEARPGFERQDVDARRAGFWAFGLFGVVVLVAAVVGGLFVLLLATTAEPPVSAVERAPLPPPEPRLQASPAADLAAKRAAEQRQLEGLGWVDRKAGIVHIPIERAMEMLAGRGWPAVQGGQPSAGGQGGGSGK